MRGEGGRERPRSHPQIIPAFRVRVSKAPMKRQTDYSVTPRWAGLAALSAEVFVVRFGIYRD